MDAGYVPQRRTDEVLLEQIEDETIVFDVREKRVHALNPTIGKVFSLCDGSRSVSAIARELGTDLSPEDRAEVVWTALCELDKSGLLAKNLPTSAVDADLLTRRNLLRKIAAVGITVPMVTSIVAPQSEDCDSKCPEGYVSDGCHCDSPANVCTKSGGTWDHEKNICNY